MNFPVIFVFFFLLVCHDENGGARVGFHGIVGRVWVGRELNQLSSSSSTPMGRDTSPNPSSSL